MKRTVLIVGAAGGVGMALAKVLSARGYNVVGTVLDDTEAEAVRAAVPDIGWLTTVDLSNADNLLPALAPLRDDQSIELVGVTVCAAISPYGPLETTPLAGLRRTIEINTVADVAVYQACMPMLRKTKGRFVFIVSNAGRFAIPFIGHYVASKFALEGLGDVMRREASKWDVPVILIEPGGIKTNMVYQQIATIKDDIADMSAQVRNLYEDLFLAFQGILDGVETAMPPETVAECIVHALETDDPQTRYQIGQDSIDSIQLARTASDREIDEILGQQFANAAAAARARNA
ncbi:MAG: SDR family NAD(P)-dependent oxidoreductase [Steroidobacteraceae bacterium]